MKRKLGVLIFFLAIGILVYINRLDLMTWIQNYGQQSIVLTTIAATLFALFPVIPFPKKFGFSCLRFFDEAD